ncbi:Protein TRPA-2, partial [Aphelenchoides avenae]
KDNGHWKVIRHPLVLNFVNERILRCTVFYGLHVLFYFIFLFLLYSYIHGPPTVFQNAAVTVLVLIFFLFMFLKGGLKLRDAGYRALSFWFQVSYTFNFLTLSITLFYVWSSYFFNFDDYNKETKKAISWLLPIAAILSSWLNCLYILRKAPCGPYIMMMSRILCSFLGTTIIWIPTLFCFAFAFQLVMRDSGTHPWDDPETRNTSSAFLVMFQSFIKTSAMMIGEVEANDFLERKAWVASLLLILFEITTVIVLMNLMISLAVGDVQQLRQNAEDALLKIKVNFCIDALHMSELAGCLDGLRFVNVLHRAPTNNVLVVYIQTDNVFSQRIKAIRNRFFDEANNPIRRDNQVFDLVLGATGLRLRKEVLTNRSTLMSIQGATFHLVESSPSGINPVLNRFDVEELEGLRDDETLWRKFQRWLVGLNLKALLVI